MRVPKYGSLTVSEAITLSKLLTPDLQKLLADPLSTLEATFHLRVLLTAVLLISRYDPTLTLETIPALSIDSILTFSDFLLQEQRGEPVEEESKDGKPIDWNLLWWQLQRHYPHEPRFSASRFGNCPILFVRQAIKSLREERIERLSEDAIALSLHGTYTVQVQGGKKVQPEWFNPWKVALDKQEAKAEVPNAAAKLFLELSAQQRVPAWVIDVVDIQKLRYAGSD